MSGLTDRAGGEPPTGEEIIAGARQSWEGSMLRRLDALKDQLRTRVLEVIANFSGADYGGDHVRLEYWGHALEVTWPSLDVQRTEDNLPCSTFDTAMVIYYLYSADGTPMADRWIGFRELPSGGFYHQAFQGYSGDLIARTYGERPERFTQAARALEGWALPALAPHAFAFHAFPRIRLAAAVWPGDEEFPSKATVLFDAAASHYMTTDGLALLGAGLARRLLRTDQSQG